MTKIIYYNQEIDKKIKQIVLNEKIELDYQGPVTVGAEEKRKISFFDKLFSSKAPVGAPGIEGFIPYIMDGLTIVQDVSWELIKAITLHEFIKLYEVTQTKEKQHKDNKTEHVQLKEKRVLQIITDQCASEAGEQNPHEKSTAFIFTDELTSKQLEDAFLQIPKIRNKIKGLLNITVFKNVDRIECIYENNNWSVEFKNYSDREI